MKKLHVSAELPTDPDTAWEVFESDAFYDRLEQETGMASELLEEHTEGRIVVRRMKFTSGNDLPKVAAKALGAPRLSYEQVNRFDPETGRLDWKVNLAALSDRVRVEGATTITPAGEGRSRRVVDGEIEVKLRLIGGQIEKVVVGEFEKSMQRAVDIARDLIRARAQS